MSNDKQTGLHLWLPPREIEARIELIRGLEVSDQRTSRMISGLIGTVVGFILGYFTWAIWPLNNLIYKLFTECFLQ